MAYITDLKYYFCTIIKKAVDYIYSTGIGHHTTKIKIIYFILKLNVESGLLRKEVQSTIYLRNIVKNHDKEIIFIMPNC